MPARDNRYEQIGTNSGGDAVYALRGQRPSGTTAVAEATSRGRLRGHDQGRALGAARVARPAQDREQGRVDLPARGRRWQLGPPTPPPFDARSANDAWVKRVLKEDGTAYAVFEKGGFHALNRWMLGIGEFDSKGLLDAVKTNAVEQNQIKGDVDQHGTQIANLRQRVAALEAQPVTSPFPA